MSIDPALALGAAGRPAPGGSGAASGRVLVAGAVGWLGEALLTEALARAGQRGVVALADADADATMSFGVRGLSLAPLHALPPLDAAVVAQGDPAMPGARSFHGRDAPFAAVDAASVQRIAAAASAAGARRLVLIHPLPFWQQLSQLHLGLSGEAELRIAQLPFDGVAVLRPLAQGAGAAGGWLQRVANAYLSLQFLMVPRSLPTLTSAQVARVAIDVLLQPETGLRILGAAQIAERAGAHAARRRLR
jgi:hypothetical protein